MQMISGTVKNAVQLQVLNNKWQQKRDSGKLTKDERNARENWTKEDYLIQDIKEQAEQNRKAEHDTRIDNKIMAGGTLTPDEEKLKKCRTKEEVERVKLNTMGEYASALKKVVNDPLIPKSEKLAKAREMLAKTNNVQNVHISFVNSSEYEELPAEGEEAVERTKERQAQYDSQITRDDSSDTTEGEESAADGADQVEKNEDSHEEHRKTGKKASSVHSTSVAVRTDIVIDDIKDVCAKTIGQSVNFTI